MFSEVCWLMDTCVIYVQSDVFLISSNAMTYNAPDTIYYRQVIAVSSDHLC